jgi:hypothetical protein
MTLNLVSNSGLEGNKGGKAISTIGAGGLQIAEVSGGTVVDYSEAGITWRQHELRSTGSLTVSKPGYVEAMLLIAGGGNAGSNSGQYTGGGGGGGGVFWRRWAFLPAQNLSATIGGATQNSSATIQGHGTIPGDPIVCSAGTNGGSGGTCGGGGTFCGTGESNGGGRGGCGGVGGAPGCSTTGGYTTLPGVTFNGLSYGQGGSPRANSGNGANAGSQGAGSSGIFLLRYPLIDV